MVARVWRSWPISQGVGAGTGRSVVMVRGHQVPGGRTASEREDHGWGDVTVTASAQGVLQSIQLATGIARTAGLFKAWIDQRGDQAGENLCIDFSVTHIVLEKPIRVAPLC